jgi:uncharacterized membrane protein
MDTEPENRDWQEAERAEAEPTSLGLDARFEATLAYLLGFLTGIAFLALEKRSRFVRFHAMQSTMTFGGIFVVLVVLQVIPILGRLLGVLVWLVALVLWIHLMYRAYQGERYKLPYVGDLAEEQLRA